MDVRVYAEGARYIVEDSLVCRHGEGATIEDALADHAASTHIYHQTLKNHQLRLSGRMARHLGLLEWHSHYGS